MGPSLDDLTPPGWTGWVDEITVGEPIDGPDAPDVVRVKIVAGPDGVRIVAAAEDAELARRILESLGIPPDKIRQMLCG